MFTTEAIKAKTALLAKQAEMGALENRRNEFVSGSAEYIDLTEQIGRLDDELVDLEFDARAYDRQLIEAAAAFNADKKIVTSVERTFDDGSYWRTASYFELGNQKPWVTWDKTCWGEAEVLTYDGCSDDNDVIGVIWYGSPAGELSREEAETRVAAALCAQFFEAEILTHFGVSLEP